MIEFFLIRSAHNKLWRWRIPDRRVLARLAVPGSVFLSDVPTRLVGKPIVGPGEHCAPLVPDDLLMVHETDSQQAVKNFASESRRMPCVRDFETRDQRKCLGPVGARVAGDGRFLVPLGPMFQTTGLGGSTFVQV